MHKKIKLKDILPNPFRNLERYPFDDDKIKALNRSIDETGFWENIVARPCPYDQDKIEVAYGHHRLKVLQKRFDPEDEFTFNVIDLDDEKMLKIMASENLEEWGGNFKIEQETVRAVVQAYANNKIGLGNIENKTKSTYLRYAPNFKKADGHSTSNTHPYPYTAQQLADFLSWDRGKVNDILNSLEAIENAILEESDFDGLNLEHAREVIRDVNQVIRQQGGPDKEGAKEAAKQMGKKSAQKIRDGEGVRNIRAEREVREKLSNIKKEKEVKNAKERVAPRLEDFARNLKNDWRQIISQYKPKLLAIEDYLWVLKENDPVTFQEFMESIKECIEFSKIWERIYADDHDSREEADNRTYANIERKLINFFE